MPACIAAAAPVIPAIISSTEQNRWFRLKLSRRSKGCSEMSVPHAKSGDDEPVRGNPIYRYGLLLICCLLPVAAHVYTLKIPFPLNVDEAQWTASARTLLTDFVFWRSSDLTTSGPLNGLAITWPYLFGHIPSLYTSRLTGLVLQAGIFTMMASTLRLKDGLGPASAATIIALAFLSSTSDLDLIHYGSELVSVFLIAVFCVLYTTRTLKRSGPWRLAICGLLASCLPFAKLQSSPFCVLFHCLIVWRIYGDSKGHRTSFSDVAAYIALSLLPAFIFVAPLFFVGEQQAFVTGYLQLGAGYGGHRNFQVFKTFLPYILAMTVLMVVTLIQVSRTARLAPVRADLLVLGISLWPVAALTVWLPGRSFVHYANYLVYCLPLAICIARRAANPSATGGRDAGGLLSAMTIVISICTIVRFILPPTISAMKAAESENLFRKPDGGRSSRTLFAWTGVSTQDSMLMWGWMPELTVYSDLKPAGRSSHGEYLIRPTREREYFRDRLIRDLSGNEPALVVDAIRPDYFFTNYPGLRADTSNLPSFPQLFDMIEKNYDKIGTPADCAAIYLRRDKAIAWRKAEITLQSDAAALVDNSITERCNDWWAPPAGAQAMATLTLIKPEPIREVWVLASRGGKPRDRGTNKIDIRFVQTSGLVADRSVMLFDYPVWTVIQNDTTSPIARLIVTPLSNLGSGAALNEVKAFRVTSNRGMN